MNKSFTKKVFWIAMAVVVATWMIYWLYWKIQNWECTAENNYCEETVNKISDQVEIIENNVDEINFDE